MSRSIDQNVSEALLTDQQIFGATRNCIEAWNVCDLEATLATYTDDVVYRDPKILGRLYGKDDLRRYLTKFFEVWTMTFTVIDERRLAGENGQLCMWDCEITNLATGRNLTVPGMDLCMVRGGQLCRDEAFMDTLPLETLKTP